ncbi:5'/3'-nucleotidase SurE [soil metagenome]
MRRILLTNDDGIDSPALIPLARALGEVGDVTVVVPDRECSWVAKAITRFDPVSVEKTHRGGVTMFTTSGYPADATQLGVYGLLGNSPPDLVVSGINLGYNHGAGFLMSSGTVGAAVEAWISGIDAVAVSTGVMSDWHMWRTQAESPDSGEAWAILAAVTVDVVRSLDRSGLHDLADVVSVNMPFQSTLSTPRRVTTIARVGYDRLFAPTGDGRYSHQYSGGIRHHGAVDGNDIDAAHDGVISVTPILMPQSALVPDDIRRSIESR